METATYSSVTVTVKYVDSFQKARRAARGLVAPDKIGSGHRVSKRDSSVPYPARLPKIVPAALVSSACNCYIKSPSPVIKTATQTTGMTTITTTVRLLIPFVVSSRTAMN